MRAGSGIAVAHGLLDGPQDDLGLVGSSQSVPSVEDGDVITSAGISAGIDPALRAVALHHGEAVAQATARHMEYPFPVDNRRRV